MKQPGCEVGIVHLFIFPLRPGKQKKGRMKSQCNIGWIGNHVEQEVP